MDENQIREFVHTSVPKRERNLIDMYLNNQLYQMESEDTFVSGDKFLVNRKSLDRINLNSEIQIPREDFLQTLKEPELESIIETYDHFLQSQKDSLYRSSFSLLAVGSIVCLNRTDELKKLFEEHGLSSNDYITEHASNWGSHGDKQYEFENKTVKIQDILDENHNDIDLLISPDSITGEIYKNISFYKDLFCTHMKQEGFTVKTEVASQHGRGFLKNPETDELVMVKSVQYMDNAVKITDFKKEVRPIHVYFKNAHTDIKIKNDIANENKFSILLRRNDLMDLQCAVWNGIHNDIYENPLYVK